MKTAEARFLAKVRDRQTSFGGEWENVISLALQIDGNGDNRSQLFAQWADPAPVSVKELLEALLLKKDLGVDDEQLLSEAGYGAADITRMLATRTAREAEADREFNAA